MLGRHLRRLVPDPVARADLRTFRWVAGWHAPILDAGLPRLSRAANRSALWVGIAAVLAARGGRPGRRAALRGVASIGVTSTIANLPAKLLTARTRPDLSVVPEVRHLARVPTSTSFPSGHSASAAAFATAVGLELPRARAPLGALAAGVAFSRVYTGVHYPGDVLAGVALGGGVALASTRAWPLVDHTLARGQVAGGVTRPGRDGEGLVIVANSHSGPALLPGPAGRLREALPAATVQEVTDPARLREALADAAAHALAIGIAGGDGSVNTAAGAAQAAGVPLLVVPAGTLNRLASDIGLADVDGAVAALRDGDVVTADVADIGGQVFVNAAGIGFYPRLVDARERLQPRLGKWPALLLALAWTLPTARPVEVEIDGMPQRVWMLFAGNGRYSAAGVAPTHRRRLDDGVFDLRVLRADRRWAPARFLAAAALGRLDRCAVFEQRRVRSLHVASRQGPLRLVRDGETFDGPETFTIAKRDRPLLLFCPPAADRGG